MRSVFNFITIIICLLFSLNTCGQWKPLGSTDQNEPALSTANNCSSGIDSNDNLYLAYITGYEGNFNFAVIRKYSSNSWTTIGILDTARTTEIHLAVNKFNNLPYIVFRDSANGNKITVLKFNGSGWDAVGNAGFSPGSATDLSILFDSNGVPYVAFEDENNMNAPSVMEFVNGNWLNVGPKNVISNKVSNLIFGIDSNDILYLGYIDNTTFYGIVQKYAGGNWNKINNDAAVKVPLGGMSLSIDKQNIVYLGYIDQNRNSKVIYFNGTAWVNFGNILSFNSGSKDKIKLAIDNNNNPLLLMNDVNVKGILWKYNGTSWVMGTNNIPLTESISDLNLFSDRSNNYYICYNNFGLNSGADHIVCQEFISGNWTILGSSGISDGRESIMSDLAIDSTGIPYAIFNSVLNRNVSVKKYVGGQWIYVGAQMLSPSPVYFSNIVIGKDGNPVVLYTSGQGNDSIRISKLINNTWTQLGDPIFARNNITDRMHVLSLDKQGIPYVLYNDSLGLSVKKFVNGKWSLIGNRDFSIHSYGKSIVIDSTGEPVVTGYLYSSSTSAFKIIVNRFDGNSWTNISNGVDQFTGNYPNIAIDPKGYLYLSFSDSGRLNVFKFISSMWSPVGGGLATSNSSDYQACFAFDTLANPYISYTEVNDYKLTVKKLNNGIWSTLGEEAFTNGEIMNGGLHYYNNKLFAGYSARNTYVKYFDLSTITLAVQDVVLNTILRNQDVLVNWKIGDIKEVKEFIVQKSLDGGNFLDTKRILTTEALHYSYSDIAPSANVVFYRVLAISNSGKIIYSNISRVVINNSLSSFSIFPNPIVNKVIKIQFKNKPVGQYRMAIFDAEGNLYEQNSIYHWIENGIEEIKINFLSSNKIYYIRISGPDNKTEFKKFIIN